MPVSSVDKIILTERPAGIHYCPELSSPWNLVVSTYQLEKDSVRKGSLWFLDDEHNTVNSLTMSGGVFRFAMFPDGTALIASLTNGALSTVNLVSLTASDLIINADAMLLSVALFQQRVVTSDNQGNVHIVDLPSGNVASFAAARLKYTNEPCEVWCTEWHNNGKCVISGGEDALLKLWDVRCNCQTVMCNSSHESGVTFVKRESDTSFITGSYDEHIRRFDFRNIKKPICQQMLDGGIWNVEDADKSNLLVACMYNGWALVNRDTFSVNERKQDAGDFILYGATQCGEPSLIASCTFNNYTVHFDKIT